MSLNLPRISLNSLPKRLSSGLKISCRSLVSDSLPSKSQMAIGAGNMRLNAQRNSSSVRTQSLRLSVLRFGGTNAQISTFSGISPGTRWIFLMRIMSPFRKGLTAAAFSSPRRFSTFSVMPSKMPSTSTGLFGSSKKEMSREKRERSQRMPIRMLVFPALL